MGRQKLGVLGAGRGLFRLLGGDDVVLARQVLIPLVVEQRLAGLAFHGLALEQHAGHEVHLIGMGGQNRMGPVMGLLHDLGHLFIDATGRLLGVILGVAIVAAQEHLVVGLAEHLSAQRTHAVLGDNGAGHLACALKVVGGAGGDIVAEELLGHAASHEHRQLVFHLGKRVQNLVLVGNGKGVAQRSAARDDRDLVHRIGMVEQMAHERVPALVVGDGMLGLLVHHTALTLRAGDDALHRLAHLAHGDDLLAAPRREQGRFVHEVRQIGAGEARGDLRDLRQIDIRPDGLVLGMHLQDALAALHVGGVHDDLAVEAAGTQKRRIEHVGAVRGRDEHHGVVGLEAVHFHEQLVQGLLALVVTAAKARAALAPHRVNLVDEDDGGGSLFRILEQIAHAARAHAHEHLDEVRARDAEERHARLAGHGAREQGFAGARRAHEQAASRNLRTHGLVLGGIGQKVLDLLHLLHGLIDAGHIGKRHVGALLQSLLRLVLPKAHLGIVGLLHLVEEEHQKAADDEDGQKRGQNLQEGTRQRHLIGDVGVSRQKLAERIGAHIGGGVIVLFAQRGRIERRGGHAAERLAVIAVLGRHEGVQGIEGPVEGGGGLGAGGGRREVGARHRVVAGGVGDRLHAALLHRLGELGGNELIGHGGAHGAGAHELAAHEKCHGQEDDDHDHRGALGRRRRDWFLGIVVCHS